MFPYASKCFRAVLLALIISHGVAAQSRWSDFEVYAGTGKSAPVLQQKGDFAPQSLDFGTSIPRRGLLEGPFLSVGAGICYKMFRSDKVLPDLHLSCGIARAAHELAFYQVSFGVIPPGVRPALLTAFSNDIEESILTARIAPMLQMAQHNTRGIHFYARLGPALHLLIPDRWTNKYAIGNLAEITEAWDIHQKHFVALAAEMGFGYRDFFLFTGYDYGLTRYGDHRALYATGAYRDLEQKYRVFRVGFSYHPRLTKRLLAKEQAASRRATAPRRR